MANHNERFQSPSGSENDSVERDGNGRNRPWLEVRSGMLKATVWENRAGDGTTYTSTQLSRLYKDANNQWQETTSLGREDLLRASHLLTRVFDQIEDAVQQRRREQT